MNCRCAQSRISAYIDRELSGRDMLALRQHLDACAECAAEYEGLLALKRMVGSHRASDPNAGFEQRLHAAVFAEKPVARANRETLWPWAALTATVSALFVLMLLQRSPALGVKPAAKEVQPVDIARDGALQQESDPLGAPSFVMTVNGSR